MTNQSNSTQDTEDVVETVAIECHHASCANVPRHNPDYDRSAYPWEHCPTPAKDAWRAIARAALEAADRQSLSDRIDVLTQALGSIARYDVGLQGLIEDGEDTPDNVANYYASQIKRRRDIARAALHQEGIAPK